MNDYDFFNLKKTIDGSYLRRNSKNLPSYIWSYIWTVVYHLIELIIIIKIFDFASNSFEIVIFSLLIMIYFTTDDILAAIRVADKAKVIYLNSELSQIKLLLKYQESDEEKEEREEAMEMLNKEKTELLISRLFLGLFFLIALLKLLSAII
jgi:hypothetical protein